MGLHCCGLEQTFIKQPGHGLHCCGFGADLHKAARPWGSTVVGLEQTFIKQPGHGLHCCGFGADDLFLCSLFLPCLIILLNLILVTLRPIGGLDLDKHTNRFVHYSG